MDADYARNKRADGEPFDTFEHALFVYATVMSVPAPERVVVDAGHKALAVDSGMPAPWQLPGAIYHRPSDEHGILDRRGLQPSGRGAATRCCSSPATAIRPSTCTTGTSACAGSAAAQARVEMPVAGGGARRAVLISFACAVGVNTSDIGHCEAVIATRYVGASRSAGGIPMTPEERQLISGLFDRMRSYGAPDKDREAEALIAQSVRANPDATYMLVQSVLVQEQALEAANNRVQELEEQLRAMEGGERRAARARAVSWAAPGTAAGAARSRDPACPRSARAQRRRPTTSRSPWSQGACTAAAAAAAQQAPAAVRRRLHEVGAGHGCRRCRRHAAGRQPAQHAGWRRAREPVDAGRPARRMRDAEIRQDESDNDPGTDTIAGTDDAGNDPGFDSGGGDDGIEI